jgi:hypothetical protein
MPNIPSAAGVFIPGFLNTVNTASPSGQGDPYGNIYPSGLTPGKVVMVAPGEAQSVAAPGTVLYDGAYQFILLDSGATAANATLGMAGYFRLDSGPTVGALPETDYNNGSVTTYDQVTNQSAAALFAGVFVNPATLLGQANGPTPGNYTFLFVGAGRAQCNVSAAGGTPAIGDAILPTGVTNSGFTTVNAASISLVQSITVVARAVTVPSTVTGVVGYFQNLFYRIFNQGV